MVSLVLRCARALCCNHGSAHLVALASRSSPTKLKQDDQLPAEDVVSGPSFIVIGHEPSTPAAENGDPSVEPTPTDVELDVDCAPGIVAQNLANSPLGDISEELEAPLVRHLPLDHSICTAHRHSDLVQQQTTTKLWSKMNVTICAVTQIRFMILTVGTSGVGKAKATQDLALFSHAVALLLSETKQQTSSCSAKFHQQRHVSRSRKPHNPCGDRVAQRVVGVRRAFRK